MTGLDLKIEYIEASKLINYALNAKLHTPEQVEELAASIKEFGFVNPILIGEDNVIIAGHGRIMAARKLDMQTVPVIRVDHLTEMQRKALVIVDNKIQMNTGFDLDILKIELQAIQTSGFEIKPLGFSTLEMRELFSLPDEVNKEPEPEEQKPEEEPEDVPVPTTLERKVNVGEVWKLGNHTLICGDSSDETIVHKHIAEHEAHSIVTDPPYGLGTIKDIGEYLKSWLSDSSTDHLVGAGGFMNKEWDKEVPPPSIWKTWMSRARPGAHALVFAGTRTQDLMGISLRIAGFETRDILSWVYSTGFPKSLDISKAIDKEAGAVRKQGALKFKGGTQLGVINDDGWEPKDVYESEPSTDAAKQWSGFGSAIKPAQEPISWVTIPLKTVPLHDTLQDFTNALEVFLWSVCPAKLAEKISKLKLPESSEAQCDSVRWIAGLLDTTRSDDSSELMAMFSSPEQGAIFLSTAILWNSILAVSLKNENTFTIETELSLITGLKIWKSLISANTLKNTANQEFQNAGNLSSAPDVTKHLSDIPPSLTSTPTHSALENVSTAFTLTILVGLVEIAELSFSQSAVTRENFVQILALLEKLKAQRETENNFSASNAAEYSRTLLATTVHIAAVLAWPKDTQNIEPVSLVRVPIDCQPWRITLTPEVLDELEFCEGDCGVNGTRSLHGKSCKE